MATVTDIFEQLGGSTAIAARIAVPLTTVHSWKRSGYVPAWRIPALVKLAKSLGKPIAAADFPQRRAASATVAQAA